MKSSTVMPAARIKARSVPTESSLCWGMDRLARTPDLIMTRWLPTCPAFDHPAFPKVLAACLPEMLLSLPIKLDGHHYGLHILPLFERGNGLLVFRPQPGGDGFLDVVKGFFLVLALRHAAGQRGTLGHNPAVLSLLKSNVEDHSSPAYSILPYVLPLGKRRTARLLCLSRDALSYRLSKIGVPDEGEQ